MDQVNGKITTTPKEKKAKNLIQGKIIGEETHALLEQKHNSAKETNSTNINKKEESDNLKKTDVPEQCSCNCHNTTNNKHLEGNHSNSKIINDSDKLTINEATRAARSVLGKTGTDKVELQKQNEGELAIEKEYKKLLEEKHSNSKVLNESEKSTVNMAAGAASSVSGKTETDKLEEKNKTEDAITINHKHNTHSEEKNSSSKVINESEKLTVNMAASAVGSVSGKTGTETVEEIIKTGGVIAIDHKLKKHLEEKHSDTKVINESNKLTVNMAASAADSVSGRTGSETVEEKNKTGGAITVDHKLKKHFEEKHSDSKVLNESEKSTVNVAVGAASSAFDKTGTDSVEEKHKIGGSITIDNRINKHLKEKHSNSKVLNESEKSTVNMAAGAASSASGKTGTDKLEEKNKTEGAITINHKHSTHSAEKNSSSKVINESEKLTGNMAASAAGSVSGKTGSEIEEKDKTGGAMNINHKLKKHLEEKHSDTNVINESENLTVNMAAAAVGSVSGKTGSETNEEKNKTGGAMTIDHTLKKHLEEKHYGTNVIKENENLTVNMAASAAGSLSDNTGTETVEVENKTGGVITINHKHSTHSEEKNSSSKVINQSENLRVDMAAGAAGSVSGKTGTETVQEKKIGGVITIDHKLKKHLEEKNSHSSVSNESDKLTVNVAAGAAGSVSGKTGTETVEEKKTGGPCIVETEKFVVQLKATDSDNNVNNESDKLAVNLAVGAAGSGSTNEATKVDEKQIQNAGELIIQTEHTKKLNEEHSTKNIISESDTLTASMSTSAGDSLSTNSRTDEVELKKQNDSNLLNDSAKLTVNTNTENVVKSVDSHVKGNAVEVNKKASSCVCKNLAKGTLANGNQDTKNDKSAVSNSEEGVVDVKTDKDGDASDQAGILSKLLGFFGQSENDRKEVNESNKESEEVNLSVAKESEDDLKTNKKSTAIERDIKVITMEFIEDCCRGTIEEKIANANSVFLKSLDVVKDMNNGGSKGSSSHNTKKQSNKNESTPQPIKKHDKLLEENNFTKSKGPKGKKDN